ncbi:hypothetical protein PV10_05487 [Exophiala mesophila]|uniref:Uncharacterized protein n=1 Tax=Exophiala mesophila TaxID=212818 RepID=A0A0D1ZVN5_EXOME|nr:uncharacterized protein PV10_05487 [Exophiala mesophila]KIV90883.1 hypothetical protein PV10_05487 [Exophiala mesophila]
MGMDAIESGLNCEKTWTEFFSCSFPESPERAERLLRLSLRIPGSKIQLDEVDKMARLEEMTRQQYGPGGPDHSQIARISAKLVASVFYFDLEARLGEHITGFVKCRFCQDRTYDGPLAQLARGLRKLRPSARRFLVYPNALSPQWQTVEIPDTMLEGVLLEDLSFEIRVTFDVPDQAMTSRICLLLDLDPPTAETISGFPRVIQNKEATQSQPRPSHILSLASYRSFANRSEAVGSMPSYRPSPDVSHSFPASPNSLAGSETGRILASPSPTTSDWISNQRLLAEGYFNNSSSLPNNEMDGPTVPAAYSAPSLASLPTGYHSKMVKGPSGSSTPMSYPGMSSSGGPTGRGIKPGFEETSKLSKFSKMLDEYSGGLRRKKPQM